ncbi:MAG: DUF3418 domain-containing protein, partial [Gammaproteobacteria bacterium]|nr:DUF3418 domain-containing protein [Gammaproteobacteria bacterium]NNJ84326.1 DUF3418 domain-containing protein [Gammaproteobacteria bacterium]
DKTKDRASDKEYTGARSTRFLLGRDSVLNKSRPQWVMAAELVHTTRIYAHNVARIRPEWVEKVGRDLIKTTYFDSHWDETNGEVMAYERLTLYGLTIIGRRKIPYASVNPEEARELFIEAALVEERFFYDRSGADRRKKRPFDNGNRDNKDTNKRNDKSGDNKSKAEEDRSFFTHNQAFLAHLREMEQRSRRPDAFVNEAALYQFYAKRIPSDVTGSRSFDAWRKQAERTEPQLLFLSAEDLCDPAALSAVRQQFPDELVVRGQHLRLSYRFDPGESMGNLSDSALGDSTDSTLDGVTVTLLQNALHQLDPGPFQWLVPGLLEEKTLALLRALPKPLRRTLPPIAEMARACLLGITSEFILPPHVGSGHSDQRGIVRVTYPERSLLVALGEHLRHTARVALSPEVWREDRLPPYLRINFHVIDARGKTLRMGRDLQRIRQELAPDMDRILPRLPQAHAESYSEDHFGEQYSNDFHRDGFQAWDFPDLPTAVEVAMHGTRFPGYPAIVDKGESVSLRLVDSPDKATELSRAGVCRLLMLAMPREIRYLAKNLPDLQKLCLTYATLNHEGASAGDPGNQKKTSSATACDELREDLVRAIIEQTFLDSKAPIRTRAAFEDTLEKHARELMTVANELCRLTGSILNEYRTVVSSRAGLNARVSPVSLTDISEQLNRLVFRGFIRATPAEWLPHLPRYLRAMARRLEKLSHASDKDHRKMEELIPLQQAHAALVAANLGESRGALERQRWLLEELRVSLFAQELGTTEPISVKRMHRQLGQ